MTQHCRPLLALIRQNVINCRAGALSPLFTYGHPVTTSSHLRGTSDTSLVNHDSISNSKLSHEKRTWWTAEKDKRLQQLVEEKGGLWNEIAVELGITGSSLKVRRRWEVLQPKLPGAWTKSEDSDLAQVIKSIFELGYKPSDIGMWIKVAQLLKTDRSPRQCHIRWVRTLLPRQGVAMPFTRFEHIRAWRWSDSETTQLKLAIASIYQISDSPHHVKTARKREPWLVIDEDAAVNSRPHYWNVIAAHVGTRTASQCLTRWKSMSKSSKTNVSLTTTDEARKLAQLVAEHGYKWSRLAELYFPKYCASDLRYIYTRWQRVETNFNVDLLSIDPFSIIKDYDGRSAMRPTGPDGNYDPDGPLKRVFKSGRSSFMTPYILALMNTGFRKKTTGILRAMAKINNTSGMSLPVESIEKLVSAVRQYQNDWISISRETGLPIHTCRKYAYMLGKSLTSIKRDIDDPEMNKIAIKRGWGPESPNAP